MANLNHPKLTKDYMVARRPIVETLMLNGIYRSGVKQP